MLLDYIHTSNVYMTRIINFPDICGAVSLKLAGVHSGTRETKRDKVRLSGVRIISRCEDKQNNSDSDQ